MRDRVVTVRLTAHEYQQLHDRAEKAGRSVSQEIREWLRAPSPDTAWIPPRGDSYTAPSAPSSVVWLTDGHQDGATFTLAA